MYNHTGLQGRLTADPELRYTQQGTAITSFTLASDTGDIATLTETGEIVEGVTVYETPGIFTVDV